MEERPVCNECGGEKEQGRGYRYCSECREKRSKKPGCVKCGEPKIPGSGNRYCAECSELQKWAVDKRRGFKPQRPCKKCKKVWVSGRKQYCEGCRNPVILCQKCQSQPVRGSCKKLCELCWLKSRENVREYRREWQREQRKDPVEMEKLRENARRFRERLAKDKKRRELANETRRLWWRRTHGSKPIQEKKYNEGHGKSRARLPAAPLVAEMQEYLSKGNSLIGIATMGGIWEKRVGEIYNGWVNTVRIDIADKICVACGTTLEWVYREQVAEGQIPLDGDYGLDKAL